MLNFIPRLALILILLSFLSKGSAQCNPSAAKSGTSFVDDNSNGGNFAFSNPTNADATDGSAATATALASLLTGTTDYLKITGFNFSLPSYAAICGIVVNITRREGGLLASVTDNEVRLVKNGTITGTNKAKATQWPTTFSSTSYGASNDLWGATLSVSDVNASNFGIAVSANISGLITLLPFASIDNVQITIYYNPILPIVIKDFQANANNEGVYCTWKLEEGESNASVSLQRSSAENNWINVASYNDLNISAPKLFSYLDRVVEGKYFYRLAIHSAAGAIKYSKIETVNFQNRQSAKAVIITGTRVIIPAETERPITINSSGQVIKLQTARSGNTWQLNITQLPPGIYFIITGKSTYRFLKS